MENNQLEPGEPRVELAETDHFEGEQSEVRARTASPYPPPTTGETAPYEPAPLTRSQPYRVVVGCDLGEMSESVLLEAIEMATAHAPAELHVITVTRRSGWLYRLERDGETEELTLDALHQNAIRRLKHVLADHHVAVENAFDHVAMHVATGRPAEEIVSLADDVGADLIVVGDSSPRGMSRVLGRSTAASVVRRAGASVTVVRPADFLEGHRLPQIEPPQPAHAPSHLGRRHTYHYRDPSITARDRSTVDWGM